MDPSRIAVSAEGARAAVHIETKMGARYAFPDMVIEELKKVLPQSGRVLESMPMLSMVNISMSVLSVPFFIIKQISVVTTNSQGEVNEEVLWDCPA